MERVRRAAGWAWRDSARGAVGVAAGAWSPGSLRPMAARVKNKLLHSGRSPPDSFLRPQTLRASQLSLSPLGGFPDFLTLRAP